MDDENAGANPGGRKMHSRGHNIVVFARMNHKAAYSCPSCRPGLLQGSFRLMFRFGVFAFFREYGRSETFFNELSLTSSDHTEYNFYENKGDPTLTGTAQKLTF